MIIINNNVNLIKFLVEYYSINDITTGNKFKTFSETLAKLCRGCSVGATNYILMNQGNANANANADADVDLENAEQYTIGFLSWYILSKFPSFLSGTTLNFALILQLMYEQDNGSTVEKAIKYWYDTDTKNLVKYLPNGSFNDDININITKINSLKTSKGMNELIEYLNQSSEDESGDESD